MSRESLRQLFAVNQRATPTRRRYTAHFSPPTTKAIRVRLIAGDYLYKGDTVEVLPFKEHYNNAERKYQICSSTWVPDLANVNEYVRDGQSKCVGCHLMYDQQARYVSLSAKYAVTVAVCDDFHLNPFDRQGHPLGMDKDGRQKAYKDLCTGPGCEGCKKGLEVVWGRRMVWKVPQTYMAMLMDYVDETHRHSCACGSIRDDDTGEGGLSVVATICPECGKNLPAGFAVQVVCGHCQQTVTPSRILTCAQCGHARPATIFDMDVWVKRTSRQPYTLIISKSKIGPPHPKLSAPEHKNSTRPFNLAESMAPPNLLEQCRLHNVVNPWQDQTGQPADGQTEGYDDDPVKGQDDLPF